MVLACSDIAVAAVAVFAVVAAVAAVVGAGDIAVGVK